MSATENGKGGKSPDTVSTTDVVERVYDRLRRLAQSQMNSEAPGQTLQATALVHEAYLRLLRSGDVRGWADEAHFVSTAVTTMRRILLDRARGKNRTRRGGGYQRVDWTEEVSGEDDEIQFGSLDLEEALRALSKTEARKAELVMLRYFGGLSIEEAAAVLGISRATAVRYWAFSKAWLYDFLKK